MRTSTSRFMCESNGHNGRTSTLRNILKSESTRVSTVLVLQLLLPNQNWEVTECSDVRGEIFYFCTIITVQVSTVLGLFKITQ